MVHPQRSWCQFSLASLLLFTVLCGIAFFWLHLKMKSAKQQRDTVNAITASGGWVRYNYQVDGSFIDGDGIPTAPSWLRYLFGDDMFASVTVVELRDSSDAMLAHLKQCRRLQCLFAQGEATDEGVRNLKDLRELKYIHLRGPRITDDGILALSEIQSLETVSLGYCTSITPKGLQPLHRLPRLESLDLYGTPVDASWIAQLKRFQRLKTMCIRATQLNSDELDVLKEALPNVEFN